LELKTAIFFNSLRKITLFRVSQKGLSHSGNCWFCPNLQLRNAQKAANKALSQVRIFIEHAIGGMKLYNILVYVLRNRKADFEGDDVGCAGLWNFALFY
jgi:hypothetical protein